MQTKEKASSKEPVPTKLRRPHHELTAVRDEGAPDVTSGGVAGVVGLGREGGQVAEMQRRRLLSAFAEVLIEDGLGEAGAGRVCKRAGVSRRTFYDLFEDRETCFLAVLDSNIQRISEIIIPMYTQERRWAERVRAVLALLLELFDEEPGLARVCLIETLKAGPAVSQRRRLVLDVLASAIDEGRGESKGSAELPSLTGQSIVGGAVSVIYARVLERNPAQLRELLNPLMSMIVRPYLGPAAACRELERPIPTPKPAPNGHIASRTSDPFKDLPIRLTFRTARVLAAIGSQPGASNRQIADTAGVADQGQISRLLSRLKGFGLIENNSQGQAKGEPNAWLLTERGRGVRNAIEAP